MWPKEYYIELGNQLSKKGFKILLFGGKEDRDICSTLNDEIESSLDLSNDNDLIDLAANMKICKAVICNDSGLMHTALAVRVPVITIFGSTVKEFGFAPYKGHNLVLENNSVSCRPCSHIGLDECPKNHLDCMYGLDPNYVLNESLKFIETI
jgi:heptosyltransferase-2